MIKDADDLIRQADKLRNKVRKEKNDKLADKIFREPERKKAKEQEEKKAKEKENQDMVERWRTAMQRVNDEYGTEIDVDQWRSKD